MMKAKLKEWNISDATIVNATTNDFGDWEEQGCKG